MGAVSVRGAVLFTDFSPMLVYASVCCVQVESHAAISAQYTLMSVLLIHPLLGNAIRGHRPTTKGRVKKR